MSAVILLTGDHMSQNQLLSKRNRIHTIKCLSFCSWVDVPSLSCVPHSPADSPGWIEAPVAHSSNYYWFPSVPCRLTVLPGIIYPKATCSQTLGSEAQTKTATKKQCWGNKPGVLLPQPMLLATTLFWYLVPGCKEE